MPVCFKKKRKEKHCINQKRKTLKGYERVCLWMVNVTGSIDPKRDECSYLFIFCSSCILTLQIQTRHWYCCPPNGHQRPPDALGFVALVVQSEGLKGQGPGISNFTITLQGTKISHQWERKLIFPTAGLDGIC